MDASYKIQRGIHVHLIQFFMCPEFWVHIKLMLRSFVILCRLVKTGQRETPSIRQVWISGGPAIAR